MNSTWERRSLRPSWRLNLVSSAMSPSVRLKRWATPLRQKTTWILKAPPLARISLARSGGGSAESGRLRSFPSTTGSVWRRTRTRLGTQCLTSSSRSRPGAYSPAPCRASSAPATGQIPSQSYTTATSRCSSLRRRWSRSLVFCFSLLGTFPAFAATTVQAYMVNYPRQNDPNYGDSRFGHSANYLMSGWAYVANERMTLHAIGSYNGQIAYCIEPGVDQDSGDTLTSTDESYWDNYPASSNVTIPPETIKTLLGRVLTYGYHGNISQDWMTGNASDADSLSYAIATQMLVWEVVVGERDANFDHVDPSAYGKGAVMDYIGASNPLRSQIMSYYNQIIESIKTHNVMPSFCAPSRDYARAYELEQDGSEYTLTLTDSNGVLGNYAFSASVPGISFSKSGNRLTITCDTPTEETILVTAEKQNAYSSSLVIWSDGTWSKAGVQDTITYGENVSDPVNGYFELEMDAAGGLRIVKTSEDGNVSGIEFTITGEGYSERVRTGSDGTIDVTGLMPGRYTVTEINSDAYTPQDSQTVTIAGGESAVVTFNNTLKRGALQVRKSAEDNFIEGVTFHLYGTSASGLEVDEYAVTGADGVAHFENVLISGNTPYTIEEVDTADRYVVPESQSVSILWDDVAERSFHNVLNHRA